MKILKKNLRNEEVKVLIENPEDIWALSQIIEEGDLIKGKTERKIKLGADGERNLKVIRKTVFLTIETEKTEYMEDNLKVLGVIRDGPDDIARGDHHSFRLEKDTAVSIIKKKWLKFQLKRIEEAARTKNLKILIVVFDREEAYFAKLKGRGYEIIMKMVGDVQKKDENHVSKDNFYSEIVSKLKDHEKEVEHMILASPGFWKDNLMKELPDNLKKKAVAATVSQATERGISEVLKRPELQNVLQSNRASKELKKTEKLLGMISKDKACYGLEECEQKLNEGAVSEMLVTHSFLQKCREDNIYSRVEHLLHLCEQMNGEIHIITSEEASKTLDSLSGIAGILRWKS